ncbi:hypothetical protein N4G70_12615 [Streptomyces sp. ASQP_92]|uniref:hypothetical protein n=1 Tax=Streptomyces sp. ASQP_92 TaxID=2979116 RepID=UPI0021C0A5D7|nr:hypothetical protein [Streptomyces sp. ASQP_92]MCT9089710.1 hypothetical protein [Streptomyces sp. ASQP_92]
MPYGPGPAPIPSAWCWPAWWATGLPLALAATNPALGVTAALFALAGACTGPLFSALLAAWERYAPTAFRTQIFTLGAGLKSTTAAAGAAVAGAVSVIGTGALLFAVAACQVLATLLGATLLTTGRNHAVAGSDAAPPHAGRGAHSDSDDSAGFTASLKDRT